MKKVLVIGGGPAGCATGAALVHRGFDVDVVDVRMDMRKRKDGEGVEQRSINLALSTRGLTTLDALGCGDAARAMGVPMHGRELHGLDGKTEFQAYGQPGQYLLSVSRTGLSEILLDAAEKAGCNLLFNHKCLETDLDAGIVKLETGSGEQITRQADLIVGSDGTFSKVRSTMMRRSRFDYSQDFLPAAYKELSIPPEKGVNMRREALHIWPRHRFMLIALPNQDGSFTCTLFHDQEAFDALQTENDVLKLFKDSFPDAIPLIPDLIADFFANPTPSLVTIRCHPYHYKDRALLIGDAAHAIVPFYGQGCNLALEDVRILWELLDEHDGVLKIVLSEFTERRKRNADAIAELAVSNYSEMASKTASPMFLLRRKVALFLNKLAPQSFMPLYTMISFSNIPYADAMDRARATELTTQRTLMGSSLLAVAAVASSFVFNKMSRQQNI